MPTSRENSKIYGNWSNEHAARFNANLGVVATTIGALLLNQYIFTDSFFLILVAATSIGEAIMAYYYAKHHEKT